jgi:hypothetical protein
MLQLWNLSGLFPRGSEQTALKAEQLENFLTSSCLSCLRMFLLLALEYWGQKTNSVELSLVEKPPVAQLLKKFPTFYESQSFITVFRRALHWSIS